MAASDVIVLGVGAVGSAACYQLAKRGVKVIGIDQYECAYPYRMGACGDSRIFRQAIGRPSSYLPLAKGAYVRWSELNNVSERKIFHQVGAVYLTDPRKSDTLKKINANAARFDIEIVSRHRKAFCDQYAHLRIPDRYHGVFEAQAGYLHVEACVEAHVWLAEKNGAKIFWNEPVRRWTVDGDGVTVVTTKGQYTAQKLVIAAGPWSRKVLSELELPLKLRRKFAYWFTGSGGTDLSTMPCFSIEMPYGRFSGIPASDEYGMKISEETSGLVFIKPDNLTNDFYYDDFVRVERFIDEVIPSLSQKFSKNTISMIPYLPNNNFVVDYHPTRANVVVATGLSEDGFQLSPVIGELLADLATDAPPKYDIEFLKFQNQAWHTSRADTVPSDANQSKSEPNQCHHIDEAPPGGLLGNLK